MFALIVLLFSAIQPALMAYGKEGEGKQEQNKAKDADNKGNEKKQEDKKAEEKKNEEQKGNEGKNEKKQANSTITAEQAKANATKYLIQRFGNAKYNITESKLEKGDYEVRVSNGTATFNVGVSGKNGKILFVEIRQLEKKQEKQAQKKEQEGAKEANKEEKKEVKEEAKEDKKEAKDEKKEDREVQKEVKEEKKDDNQGRKEDKGERKEDRKEERVTAVIKINASQAVSIALGFLTRAVGSGNYSVVRVEPDDKEFKIEIVRENTGFKVKVDAITGKVVEFEQEEKKEVKLKVEKEDEKHIKIDIKKEDVKQKLNVEVQKSDSSLKLQFQGKENTTKSELELRVLFERLIEFRDNGSKPGKFDSNDTVVSSIDLRRLKWNVSRVENKDANGTITMVTITQNASSSALEAIAFIYHLTPTTKTIVFGNATEAKIRIWQVKFDVHIRGFEWKSNDTMLALSAAFNAEFEAHIPGEDTVKFKRADGITPFFNWGGNATADGANIVVGATLGNKSIVLTYPHFNNALLHDPLIGYIVSEEIVQILVPSLMVVGAIIIATVLLGFSALRSRRLALSLRRYSGQ